MDPHEGQPQLLLRVDSQQVAALPRGVQEILLRGAFQLLRRQPLLDLGPEGLDAELVDEPHHSALLPVAAVAQVAERLEHCLAERHDVVLRDPGVERDGLGVALGAEEAAHQEVEAHAPVLHGGDVRQVVDVRVLEEIVSADHAHVPFARQIGDGQVALAPVDDVIVQSHDRRPGIDDLVRVDACDGVADRVADVVHAALNAGQAHSREPVHDGGDVLQHQASNLPVLPGGDIGAALGAILVDDAGEEARLLAGGDAVGQLEAHHESAVLVLAAVEEAEPFEADVNIILSLLGRIDFGEWGAGQLFDSPLGPQLHGLVLELGLFCGINALAEFRLQPPVPVHDFYSRREPAHVLGHHCCLLGRCALRHYPLRDGGGALGRRRRRHCQGVLRQFAWRCNLQARELREWSALALRDGACLELGWSLKASN
ncbi:hypothetical protein Mapa_007156 [Marchantia paleacea]|nr:hypothetical protein Mapa_007156 [Marchantia paleacea]